MFSALDWFPTLVAAAGNPHITDQLLKGVKLGDRTYKNHLDGYNQLGLLPGNSPSARHEFSTSGARSWAPFASMTSNSSSTSNHRVGRRKGNDRHANHGQHPQDPFERTPSIGGKASMTWAGLHE